MGFWGLEVIRGLIAVSHRNSFVNCSAAKLVPSYAFSSLYHSSFSIQKTRSSSLSTFHCSIAMAPVVSGEVAKCDERSPRQSGTPKLFFVKMSENASAPVKGSKLAAGYDLMSAYDAIVPKRGSALVKTDIQIKLPEGTYGRVAPRSGLALKNQIDVGAGVIDEDYRGNIGVILFNHGDVDFVVSKGDRIAQLICEKIAYPEAIELESLDSTDRGAAGFGSTGIKKAKLDTEQENVPASPKKETKQQLPLSPQKRNIMAASEVSPKKHDQAPPTSPVKRMEI